MTNRHFARGLMLFALLCFGLTVSYLRPQDGLVGEATLSALRLVERTADLAIEIGLLLVGALGIRALLPGRDEEGNNELEQ